jgi:hypothetical protein
MEAPIQVQKSFTETVPEPVIGIFREYLDKLPFKSLLQYRFLDKSIDGLIQEQAIDRFKLLVAGYEENLTRVPRDTLPPQCIVDRVRQRLKELNYKISNLIPRQKRETPLTIYIQGTRLYQATFVKAFPALSVEIFNPSTEKDLVKEKVVPRRKYSRIGDKATKSLDAPKMEPRTIVNIFKALNFYIPADGDNVFNRMRKAKLAGKDTFTLRSSSKGNQYMSGTCWPPNIAEPFHITGNLKEENALHDLFLCVQKFKNKDAVCLYDVEEETKTAQKELSHEELRKAYEKLSRDLGKLDYFIPSMTEAYDQFLLSPGQYCIRPSSESQPFQKYVFCCYETSNTSDTKDKAFFVKKLIEFNEFGTLLIDGIEQSSLEDYVNGAKSNKSKIFSFIPLETPYTKKVFEEYSGVLY